MAATYSPEKMRERLKSVLKDRGISMRAASLAAGQSEGYLSGVLTLGRDPQLERLVKVCDHLNVSLTWALYGFEIPDGSDEIFQLISQNPEAAASVASLLRAQLSATDPS